MRMLTKVIISDTNYTRASVEKDTECMYIFTDNNERSSKPKADHENVDSNSWYYKKYKPTTNKPIHFGSLGNPTSAVIRGLNNAYPISTMSLYGINWNESEFDKFKKVIDDEIEQIKTDLHKFKAIKLSNFRIGQGGRYAKLPNKFQEYLDIKLKEICIDNTGEYPEWSL